MVILILMKCVLSNIVQSIPLYLSIKLCKQLKNMNLTDALIKRSDQVQFVNQLQPYIQNEKKSI